MADSADDNALGLHVNQEPVQMTLSIGKPSFQRSVDRSIFRWNDLPGELKNQIYVYALTDPEPISITRFQTRAENSKRNSELLVNLLQASKETYAEGAPIMYGENKFRFRTCQSLDQWLYKIGTEAVEWVKNITLEFDSPWMVRGARSMHAHLRAVEALENFVVVNKHPYALEALEAFMWIIQLDEASQWLLELGDNKDDRDAAIDHIFTHASSYDTLKPWIPGQVWGRHFAMVVSAVEEDQKIKLRDNLKLQASINARRLRWQA